MALKEPVKASVSIQGTPLLLLTLAHFYDQTGALIALPDQ